MNSFDALIDRSGTDSLKWDRYRGADMLPMWVADMDFASPPAVQNALHERINHGVFGYTLPPDELVDVLLARFRDMYGWSIERDWLVWLPGVVPGLVAACDAFTEPGDEVVTLTPIYPPFLHIPEHCGRRLVTAPLASSEHGYRLDAEAFERALSPHTRLLLLCQPHNPVGRVFTQEELLPLLDICRKYGVTVCSDEIHCDLILDGRPHRPVASLDTKNPERVVTLMSPGKTFNTAGLNLGFAVIPDRDMRARFSNARHYGMPHPNLLAYTAALAAYRDCDSWRQELLQVLSRNADCVQKTVTERMPGVQTHRVEATYLAWLDARKLDHDNPCALFRRFRVALSDGVDFGAPGFVRLNFGCPKTLLEKGLDRMVQAVESCRP